MGKVVDYLEKYYKQKRGTWIFPMMSSVLWDALEAEWDAPLSVVQ